MTGGSGTERWGPHPFLVMKPSLGGGGEEFHPSQYSGLRPEKKSVFSREVRKDPPPTRSNLAWCLPPLFSLGYLWTAYIVAIHLFFQAARSGDNSSGLSLTISPMSQVTLVKFPKLFFHRVTGLPVAFKSNLLHSTEQMRP